MKITLWEDGFFFFVNEDVICINNCCFHKSKSEAIPWFSNNTEAVKILASSSKQVNEAQILQIARRVTVDELAFLDPELYKKQLRNHINKEAVRRPLFTGTEQSVVEEMFEPSREDVDQIPVKLLKKKSSPTGAKTDSSPAKKQ